MGRGAGKGAHDGWGDAEGDVCSAQRKGEGEGLLLSVHPKWEGADEMEPDSSPRSVARGNSSAQSLGQHFLQQ